MVAVGIFVDIDPLESLGGNSRGLIHGGGFYLLGVQTLACVMILAWSMALTWLMLFVSRLYVNAEDYHNYLIITSHNVYSNSFDLAEMWRQCKNTFQ